MKYDMVTRAEVVRALDALVANSPPFQVDVDAAITTLNRILANKADERSWRDERCRCGHLRAFHADTCGGLALGHGPCGVALLYSGPKPNSVPCKCSKFTWTPSNKEGVQS